MASISFPTVQEIRDALIRRAEEFSRQTGMSKTEIGKRALNDGAFLSQVGNGRNFTINVYRRLMEWLDVNWPDRQQLQARAKNGHRRHRQPRKAPVNSTPRRRTKAAPQTTGAAGHFSQFRHLRADHFRTAAEIEDYINALRDEWSHR